MKTRKLLNISIPTHQKNEVLEKIKRVLLDTPRFYHIVSLNPEIVMASRRDTSFQTILNEADLALIDGVGVVVACTILGIPHGQRTPGSQLVIDMFSLANTMSLRILLIGGRPNLAEKIAFCQSQSYPKATFMGIRGHENVQKPTIDEEQKISAIVRDYRPHIVFVAFGSPQQELWIWSHRKELGGSICMGVGGTFDYLGGITPQPPDLIRGLGLEWAFRLIIQPWRWKRQLSLIAFFVLVVQTWIHGIIHAEDESR